MAIFDAAYMSCTACQHRGTWGDKFCSECGGKMEQVTPLPYIGEHPDSGTYRITIEVEYDFRNEDHVEECLYKSLLGEEEIRFSSLGGKLTYKKIKGPTKKSHPYECGTCADNENEQTVLLSDSTGGRCEYCGEQNWRRRK